MVPWAAVLGLDARHKLIWQVEGHVFQHDTLRCQFADGWLKDADRKDVAEFKFLRTDSEVTGDRHVRRDRQLRTLAAA
jgi:hypothetical protein